MDVGEDPYEGLYLCHFNVISGSVNHWSSCHSVLQREGAAGESAGLKLTMGEGRAGTASSVGSLCTQPYSVPVPGLSAGDTKMVAFEEPLVQQERLNVVSNNTKSGQTKPYKASATDLRSQAGEQL